MLVISYYFDYYHNRFINCNGEVVYTPYKFLTPFELDNMRRVRGTYYRYGNKSNMPCRAKVVHELNFEIEEEGFDYD